jgi:hypothetical protein
MDINKKVSKYPSAPTQDTPQILKSLLPNYIWGRTLFEDEIQYSSKKAQGGKVYLSVI